MLSDDDSHGVPLTTAEDKTRLYELVLDNGCPVSPYVWRIRYALAHKGLSCETVPLGFTEISRSFNGRFKTVPVLEHGDSMLAESWDIAEHLDRAFPGRPALFSGPADRASQLPALRDALAPLRAHLSGFPYLGGGAPNYADYIALGLFLWVASVSTLPMLAHDDTLRSWVDRGFDLYGGLGRDPRMHALFE